MLYIAYLPKSKGETVKDRKVNKILKEYMSHTSNQYYVISAPGYFSTAEKTINSFVNKLIEILNSNGKLMKIGFLSGMNGHHYASNTNNKQIIEVCNKALDTYKFEIEGFIPKKDYDHRKMMCFFKFNDNIPTNISPKNIDEFLEKVYVGAILVGSSNQSLNTYFEQIASKGESDIFMFDCSEDSDVDKWIDKLKENEKFKKDKVDNDLDDIVFTQSFYGKGHRDTQKFFKEILKEILINGLKEE